MKKSLIEEPTVELLKLFDKLSEEARKEKLAIPPINKMIYWWTRKPLIVGRAVVLASTLDNIEDVRNLLHLGREKRAYTYTPDVSVYKKKLGRDPSEIKVLDPFAGAGNLVLPAVQLGLDVTCSDYNPLAYLIERSVLEFPSRYGTNLTMDIEKYANQVIEETKNEIGKYFNPNHLVYFWCWCITCPHCKQRVPLTNQMYIADTAKKKIGVRFHVTSDKNFTTELIHNISKKEGKEFTQKGGKVICISCKNTIDYDSMTKDISENKDREMILIQNQNNKKRDYIIPSNEDRKLHQNAKNYFKTKLKGFEDEDLIPKEPILATHRREHMLWHYGIKHWNEFFDERQLLVLVTVLKNIRNVCNNITDKQYQKVIALYLVGILAKRVNMSGLGMIWQVTKEIPQYVLVMREPRIIYNFVETNPFVKMAGSLNNIKENILKGVSFAQRLTNSAECKLESCTSTSTVKYDIILTDPPYGNDVYYGENSEFFYVWAYRALKDFFEEIPSRAPLDEDFCECWGRFGDKNLAKDFFRKGLKKSFKALNQKVKDDGLIVIFFAHSSIDAWQIFLESIQEASMKVISSYSIHTENTSNVVARGKTAFMSSIIVTCRKLTEQKTAYFEDIIPKTEDNIKELIDKIPAEKILTIPITDLLIMVYGKVLETCTQFTELKSYEKDFTPDFKTLIEGSQDFIMRELVAKLTGRNMNLIGPEMAFYLLVRIFYRGKMVADDAIKITRAVTVDLNKLENDGMIIDVSGVKNLIPLQETNLELKPEELDNANLYQQLCYLATICQTKGASEVSAILSRTGNIKVDELKKIVPLLIKSYRLQINKNQKLDDSEQEELKILETISDTWGGTKIEGTLDGFVEK